MDKVKLISIIILITLLGYNIYTGATIQEIGIPGLFTITFEHETPTEPSPPSTSTPMNRDRDGDGLQDSQEAVRGTNPNDRDSDDDGLTDGQEVNDFNTNPLVADEDGDGLNDSQEIVNGTSPMSRDTDEDGLLDGEEVGKCNSPVNKDSDDDGQDDGIDPYPCRALLLWNIAVLTGTRDDAGTDSRIWLTLFGDKGQTNPLFLGNDEHWKHYQGEWLFEKGNTNIFEYEWSDLGTLYQAIIEKDNSGKAPGWYLERIIVTVKDNNGKVIGTWEFGCKAWLNTYSQDSLVYYMFPNNQSCKKP